MKLVSLNVAIKIANTSKVVELLKQENADIVALQEVVRHLESNVHPTYRTKADIEHALSKTYPHVFFGPIWLADSFKTPTTIKYDFGGHIEQGCEILSKFPISGGTNEFYYKHFAYMQDWSSWQQEDHGRSVLITTLDISGKPLQILNLHGIWTADKNGDERTMAQARYIVDAAKRKNIATIIVGDFNLLPTSASLRELNDNFRNLISEYGITTTRPEFQDELEFGGKETMDYIFVNEHINVKDFRVPYSTVSDHLPLILDFELS